ncbi:tripartite tricarboxylate transporter substrate binding protein [Variovorax sp. Sphag1AA]|uniref:Bug family tripartite tricarboxylate transporter substrate binding protein n=1 Tax=Variovorax sp. Sphag1AA TaxID=2587027 RepID=UPI001607736A|nr:tripartite tricarboxylate transporter substrate-binding protein [Variovorax sp. Sphag1AA]MBB3179200.1 tripartite-type tricarboxylate transporter receptor subunit TctC [Variovorax sp. Sphag1AA]
MKALAKLAVAAALSFMGFAQAQVPPRWPERPIRLVVPYPAGPGSADTIARVIGEKLETVLGQPVIVENKPGASGNISIDYVVKSPADGYTLLIGPVGPIAINPSIFNDLKFDTAKDLAPVSFVGSESFALVAAANVGATDIRNLTEKIKAKPETFSWGSSGVGSGTHLAGELFQRALGVKLIHVPYKGGTRTINDVAAGLLSITFTSTPIAASFAGTGKLTILATTGTRRSALLPAIPTMSEAGYPGVLFISWYGVFAPANVPPPIVERLHAAINIALQDPEVRGRLARYDIATKPMSIDEFKEFVVSETSRLGEVVRAANIRVQ